MSWKDNLRNASFRGVPFHVLSADTEIGRRNVLHQYPFRDEPYVEDLGLDADVFRIEAYIVASLGNNRDYFADRDSLINVIKQAGSGKLVHPFLGEKTVAVLGKASFSESSLEGGIARFRVTFVLAGEVKYPDQAVDYETSIDNSCNYAKDVSKECVGENYSSLGTFPDWISDENISIVGKLHRMIKSTMGAIKDAGRSLVSHAESILDDIGITQAVVSDSVELVTMLDNTFNSYLALAGLYGEVGLKGVVGAYSGRVLDYVFSPLAEGEISYGSGLTKGLGVSVIGALLEIYKFGEDVGSSNASAYGGTLDPIVVNTHNKAKQDAAKSQIVSFVRSMSIVTMCRVAVRTPYTSSNEAFNAMSEIINVMDGFLEFIGADPNSDYSGYNIALNNDEMFAGIQSLRPEFVEAMMGIGADLAKTATYTPGKDVISSLQLAHDLYDDLDREEDIIDRNTPDLIKHPGFLPGGEDLEVLSE